MYKNPSTIVHQMSNYKKRQLFEKNQQTRQENGTNNDSNRGEKAGSSSTTSLKNFVPSPQLESYYENYSQKQQHQAQIGEFRPVTQYYKPMKFDAYFPSSTPYSFQTEHKWFGGETFPPNFSHTSNKYEDVTTSVPPPPPSPPQQSNLHQHYQTQPKNKGYYKWETQDSGHFVWVSDEEPKQTEQPEEQEKVAIKPDISNGTGKWKWVEDDKQNLEGKIITNRPTWPTYYEQIKIYQDQKLNQMNVKDHPYSFDVSETPFNFHSHLIKDNVNQNELTHEPLRPDELSTPIKEMEILKQYHRS